MSVHAVQDAPLDQCVGRCYLDPSDGVTYLVVDIDGIYAKIDVVTGRGTANRASAAWLQHAQQHYTWGDLTEWTQPSLTASTALLAQENQRPQRD